MKPERLITAGIDVGSSAVKIVIINNTPDGYNLLSSRTERLRHRDVITVARTAFDQAAADARVDPRSIVYIATTGEGELVQFRTGHFYGMTAHGRGGVALIPAARAVLDVGALHARAIVVDERGRVLRYRMTSQCASGSGQFLENIGRYLGVALEEVGPLSLTSDAPEKCSSICAVLAETDIINMVSRGIKTQNILKGIHLSMAGRFIKLLEAAGAAGTIAVTGGLAADTGLAAAMAEESQKSKLSFIFESRPESGFAGALGSALWGAFRHRKLQTLGAQVPVLAS
ncbi:MAG: benzoyl-CoA reductase subunit D [Planctomycetes bacterium]|nr:benzoyl-CoA reductase subunit D [Planctomycetota bacterium]